MIHSTNQTLIIGFSFSLMPDGSPGPHNERIARNVLAAACEPTHSQSCISVQWEIADALSVLDPVWFAEQAQSLRLHTTPPPQFSNTEVNPTRLRAWLQNGKNRYCQVLWQRLENTDCTHTALNRLLADEQLYKDMAGLKLPPLTRPRLGDLFTEHRTLPAPGCRLLPFQRQRVNRLIIEAVVTDHDCLKRGEYLSTSGVLAHTLQHWPKKRFSQIFVAAHPEHAPRCIAQTEAELDRQHRRCRVATIDSDVEGWPFASDVAQVWCQSKPNWDAYEAQVQRLLQSRPQAANSQTADHQ